MGFFSCIRCRSRWHINWHAHNCAATTLARIVNDNLRLASLRQMRHALSMAGSLEKRGLPLAASSWLDIAVQCEQAARAVPVLA